MLDEIQKRLLIEIADLHEIPEGAYNLRLNGKTVKRNSTANIDIISKKNNSGLDIKIKQDTKNESLHIPVLVNESGIHETVGNDFYIEDNCDITIIAGCGINNCGSQDSGHNGIHTFYIGKNSRVKYIEKHYGSGTGKSIMNPETKILLSENSYMELETVQIKGIDYSARKTYAELSDGSTLIIKERLMTHKQQKALSKYEIFLNGKNSKTDIVSRSVARDLSHQTLNAKIIGNALSQGHIECNAIIMNNAKVLSIPQLEANNVDAVLVHEAAIGKIAGEQIIKLMTLGLSERKAEFNNFINDLILSASL